MPADRHRSRRHATQARWMLVALFIVLQVGNLAYGKFSFWRENPMPFTRGLVFGCGLVVTLLLGAIWQRQMWSRYVLIIFNFATMAIFSIPGLMLLSARVEGQNKPVVELIVGLSCYVLVNVVLISSQRIRRLATTPPSGG